MGWKGANDGPCRGPRTPFFKILGRSWSSGAMGFVAQERHFSDLGLPEAAGRGEPWGLLSRNAIFRKPVPLEVAGRAEPCELVFKIFDKFNRFHLMPPTLHCSVGNIEKPIIILPKSIRNLPKTRPGMVPGALGGHLGSKTGPMFKKESKSEFTGPLSGGKWRPLGDLFGSCCRPGAPRA